MRRRFITKLVPEEARCFFTFMAHYDGHGQWAELFGDYILSL